jgi:hypothetical protein
VFPSLSDFMASKIYVFTCANDPSNDSLGYDLSIPLFNFLTHLTHLTSTSLRIHEIMTMGCGLVHILRDFCLCPHCLKTISVLCGPPLPKGHPSKLVPIINLWSFDKQAAYRFSLAFQSIINVALGEAMMLEGCTPQPACWVSLVALWRLSLWIMDSLLGQY